MFACLFSLLDLHKHTLFWGLQLLVHNCLFLLCLSNLHRSLVLNHSRQFISPFLNVTTPIRQQKFQACKSLCPATVAIKLKMLPGLLTHSACLLHSFKCLQSRIGDVRINNTFNLLCCYHFIISGLKYNILVLIFFHFNKILTAQAMCYITLKINLNFFITIQSLLTFFYI